ncbi:MAG: hypothetical protein KC561_12025 [Myxococcales bacterium]|nr:hypothetical protein [Myxococcales bacterium]
MNRRHRLAVIALLTLWGCDLTPPTESGDESAALPSGSPSTTHPSTLPSADVEPNDRPADASLLDRDGQGTLSHDDWDVYRFPAPGLYAVSVESQVPDIRVDLGLDTSGLSGRSPRPALGAIRATEDTRLFLRSASGQEGDYVVTFRELNADPNDLILAEQVAEDVPSVSDLPRRIVGWFDGSGDEDRLSLALNTSSAPVRLEVFGIADHRPSIVLPEGITLSAEREGQGVSIPNLCSGQSLEVGIRDAAPGLGATPYAAAVYAGLVGAGDECEPNDDQESAQTLATGLKHGLFHHSSDRDFFTFPQGSGGVLVSAVPDQTTDLVMVVHHGQETFEVDQGGLGQPENLCGYSVSGPAVLEVSPRAMSTALASYTIELQGVPGAFEAEPNETVRQAGQLSGPSTSGTISRPGDVDYFRLSGIRPIDATRIEVWVEPADEVDVSLELRDSDDLLIASSDRAGAGGEERVSDASGLVNPIIRVAGVGNGSSCTQPYELHVSY